MILLKIQEQIFILFIWFAENNLIRETVWLVHIEVLPMQTITIYWTLSMHIAAAIFPPKDTSSSSYNQNLPVISPWFQIC